MGSLGVGGVCAQKMLLNCCSRFLVARVAQSVFAAVGGVVGEIGDAWGLSCVGGLGWTENSASISLRFRERGLLKFPRKSGG